MDGQGFINKLLKDLTKDKKLIPEIPMPELARMLFSVKPVKEYDLIKRLIGFREKYGLDYVVALPNGRRPPMVRFWKTEKTIELSEVTDEHNND